MNMKGPTPRQLRFVAIVAASILSLTSCRAQERGAPPEPAAEAETSSLEDRIDALTTEVRAALGPARDILITLTGTGTNARLHAMNRKVKGVCKAAAGDCENGVTWRLIGGHRLLTGWKVQIVEKQYGASKTGCFAAPYELTEANDSADSGPPAAHCQNPGDLWFYDVILLDEGGEQVGDPIDPLLVMYY